MLWFGTELKPLLINLNQIRAYGLSINNEPFNANELGTDREELFVSFDTTGTVVHFKSCVPTEW